MGMDGKEGIFSGKKVEKVKRKIWGEGEKGNKEKKRKGRKVEENEGKEEE